MSTTMDGRYLRGLRISGSSWTGQLEQVTTGISFSLGIDKVTMMSLGFLDDVNLNLFNSRLMDKGATLSYGEWNLTVDKVELSASSAGPQLNVEALSTYVYRWSKQFGAKTWTNVDVTQWFRDRCFEVGATPVVQPGLGTKTIVRESSLEMGFMNTWEVMAQVKRETGVWMFERGKKFIVGRPSWIMRQYGEFQEWPLYWNSWHDYHIGLTGLPTYSGRNEGRKQEALSFSLTSDDADKMRPGDRVMFGGYSTGPMGGAWIVSEVSFPMSAVGVVAVNCIRPEDPPKEQSTTMSGLGAAGAAAGWSSGTPTSSGVAVISLSNLPTVVAGYSGQQLMNAAHIIRAGQAQALPKRAAQIAVMTAIGESALRVLNYGNAVAGDARGLFQQPVTGWGTYECRMDPTCSAKAFYEKLKAVPSWNTIEPTVAAATVTGAADPNRYRPFWSSAVAVVDAILATATNSGGVASGATLPPELSVAVDRYVNSVLGKALDVDKAHGAQCVDLAMHYTIAMGGPKIYGNGRDWYTNGGNTSFYTRLSRGTVARKGDVACWGASMGGGWGHVAPVLQDQGATLRCLTQNPGPVSIMNLSKNGLDGYLRPKAWR